MPFINDLTKQQATPSVFAHFSDKGGNVIFSVISLSPSLKNRAQLLEILRSVHDLTRPRPGCIGCWLSEEEFLSNHVLYAEQWATEEALHEHIRSDLYLRLLSAIELSQRPPEVSFYYATETRGFDLVESIRQQLDCNRSR